VIGDDLLQLFAKQSSLYHKQNLEKWKSFRKSLKWADITSTEMKNNLRTDTSDGPSLKR
jgi:hypothetical protein